MSWSWNFNTWERDQYDGWVFDFEIKHPNGPGIPDYLAFYLDTDVYVDSKNPETNYYSINLDNTGNSSIVVEGNNVIVKKMSQNSPILGEEYKITLPDDSAKALHNYLNTETVNDEIVLSYSYEQQPAKQNKTNHRAPKPRDNWSIKRENDSWKFTIESANGVTVSIFLENSAKPSDIKQLIYMNKYL